MQNIRNHGEEIEGKTITVLGPGGAGSAILVQAALDGAKKVHVFAREGGPSYTRATTLLPRVQEKTGAEMILHAFENNDEMAEAIAESDILINATPVDVYKRQRQDHADRCDLQDPVFKRRFSWYCSCRLHRI